MKKKKSGFPWVETLVIGVGGLAVARIFFSNAAPPSPTVPSSPPALPASAPPTGGIPVVPQGATAHGPAYQGWVNTLGIYHDQLLYENLGLPDYKAKLRAARVPIDADYRNGLLTAADVDDLYATISGWGV